MRFAILGMAMLAGCFSIRQGQTARALGTGNVEVAIDGGVAVFDAGDGQATLPNGNIGVRVGATDQVDILGEVGLWGLGFGVKATLTPESSPIALAFAPRVNAGTLIVVSVAHFSAPVLIGIPLGEHELTLGPRIDHVRSTLLTSDVGRASLTMGGGTVGLAIQAGPARITPEVAVSRPFRGTFSVLGDTESSSLEAGVWLIQPNLFIAFEVGG
ncbi:MAG: hypothetical protein AAGA48_15195 [Myxococcota bacterium]